MTVAELLLTRQGLLSPIRGMSEGNHTLLRALDVELAALGYALSTRLASATCHPRAGRSGANPPVGLDGVGGEAGGRASA